MSLNVQCMCTNDVGSSWQCQSILDLGFREERALASSSSKKKRGGTTL
jgi:hypothetical protein